MVVPYDSSICNVLISEFAWDLRWDGAFTISFILYFFISDMLILTLSIIV